MFSTSALSRMMQSAVPPVGAMQAPGNIESTWSHVKMLWQHWAVAQAGPVPSCQERRTAACCAQSVKR